MERSEIREIVKETVMELMRSDMLKTNEYQRAGELLGEYFSRPLTERKGTEAERALTRLRGDKYFAILPLYYGQGYTIERLAERFDCETSTISRNKRRL